MSRLAKSLVLSFALIALMTPAWNTWSFVRSTTDAGVPFAWDTSCFYYSINHLGSNDIPFDVLREVTRESFDTWEKVPCSYFFFTETDPAQNDEADFSIHHGNVNLLVWRENRASWTYDANVVALTSIHYDRATGEILDVDIEFNGAMCTFANLDDYPEGTDLIDIKSTLTHEIGHTVGLDHTSDEDTTMYGWGEPGSTNKRTLTDDDINGLCSIYPLASDPETCEQPYCGLDLGQDPQGCDTTEAGEYVGCGCTTVGEVESPSGWLHSLIVNIF